MDSILTLLETTIDNQQEELNEYIKNYDNESVKILDISKQSFSESQNLKTKVSHDIKATTAQAKKGFLKEDFYWSQETRKVMQRFQQTKDGKSFMENETQLQELIEEIEGALLKEKEIRRNSDDEIVTTLNEMRTKILENLKANSTV